MSANCCFFTSQVRIALSSDWWWLLPVPVIYLPAKPLGKHHGFLNKICDILNTLANSNRTGFLCLTPQIMLSISPRILGKRVFHKPFLGFFHKSMNIWDPHCTQPLPCAFKEEIGALPKDGVCSTLGSQGGEQKPVCNIWAFGSHLSNSAWDSSRYGNSYCTWC